MLGYSLNVNDKKNSSLTPDCQFPTYKTSSVKSFNSVHPNMMQSIASMPVSSMHSVNDPSEELAIQEANNFQNVKGVYKNCRGIWAAQWTDERGQRHTKYFNPKYFTNEAAARHEAFRFKIRISHEIELKGGVKKKRFSAMPHCQRQLSSVILEPSYVRNRNSKALRKADRSNKSMVNISPTLNSEFSLPPGYVNYKDYVDSQLMQTSFAQNCPSPGVSNAKSLSDYCLNGLPTIQNYNQYKAAGYFPSIPDQYFSSDGSGKRLSNSTSADSYSANSSDYRSENQLYYAQAAFDSIYRTPNVPISNNNVLQTHQSSLYSSSLPLCSQQTLPDSAQGSSSQFLGSNTVNPAQQMAPGTTQDASMSFRNVTSNRNLPSVALCACGCASLAIYPAKYSSHHSLRLTPADSEKPQITRESTIEPNFQSEQEYSQSSQKLSPLFSNNMDNSEEYLDSLLTEKSFDFLKSLALAVSSSVGAKLQASSKAAERPLSYSLKHSTTTYPNFTGKNNELLSTVPDDLNFGFEDEKQLSGHDESFYAASVDIPLPT